MRIIEITGARFQDRHYTRLGDVVGGFARNSAEYKLADGTVLNVTAQRQPSDEDEDATMVVVRAFIDAVEVAKGKFYPDENDSGEFHRIETKPSFRRRGIATALYDHLERIGYTIDSSSNLEADGAAFWSYRLPEPDSAFWAWFGNSKVVDEDGNPAVMYHGTSKPAFDQFKLPGNRGTGGNAIFFATSPDTASYFARGGHVLPCYVRMENPFDYQNQEHLDRLAAFLEKNFQAIFPGALYGPKTAVGYLKGGDFGILEKPAVRAWMRRNKFDGFWTREHPGAPLTLAVFDPHQVKSALSNTGTYNREDPRISEGTK